MVFMAWERTKRKGGWIPPKRYYIVSTGGDLKKEVDKRKISNKGVREDKREPRETEWFRVE